MTMICSILIKLMRMRMQRPNKYYSEVLSCMYARDNASKIHACLHPNPNPLYDTHAYTHIHIYTHTRTCVCIQRIHIHVYITLHHRSSTSASWLSSGPFIVKYNHPPLVKLVAPRGGNRGDGRKELVRGRGRKNKNKRVLNIISSIYFRYCILFIAGCVLY
jgi:hypothetical protein